MDKDDKPVKKFCKVCGNKLKPNIKITGYNEYTGEAIQPYLDKMICTNKYCDSNYHGRG
jgi:hypothetical protein